MFLRQSTAAQTREVGPFLDDTDFKSLETALTIAATDVKLSANGAAHANKNSGGGTHRGNAMYALTFDATDTATVGELKYSIAVSGALVVWGTFTVIEEAVYDMLFAASATGYISNASVSVAQWAGTNVATPTVAGYPLVQTQLMRRQNTAQAGSNNTITLDASATNLDCCPGDVIFLLTNTGAGQAKEVATFNNTTKIATMTEDWPVTNPASGTIFQVWKKDGLVSQPITLSGGYVNSNVAAVNGTTVSGAGTLLDPWKPV